MPPVRRRQRLRVAAALLVASAGAGALAGFVAGVAWGVARMPAFDARVAALAGAAALVLDAGFVLAGWPRPPSVRRQVPREWGRLFDPTTAAALYGSRLGIGPLTILVTWIWWAALFVGASSGPWWSAFVGCVFGSIRAAAVAALSARAGPVGTQKLVGAERSAWAALCLCVLVAVVFTAR